MPLPTSTALQHISELHTPSELINRAFMYAKDNLARCMRYYSLGWGMSNAPHAYTIVVGRDTGWMAIGTDTVAPWFAPLALGAFRDRQKPNGQIVEYIDLESGFTNDYGLNIADNTPLYLWAVHHHWQQFRDDAFREAFMLSVLAAADHLISEIGPRGLLVSVPAGVETRGITSWRNIIPDTVIAGEVTEINSLSVLGLRCAAAFTGEERYATAADEVADAINRYLWSGEGYVLNCDNGKPNPQVTGDMIFPLLAGVAPVERSRVVLERLSHPDFWTERGMRTVPNSDPSYHPCHGVGLLGGSWPNLTLWYAAMVAPYDPDQALDALERVARPVVEPEEALNVHGAEFAEWFDGETGVNCGMHLSPWVAPTFIWAVLEGLLGLRWHEGQPQANPHWPAGWDRITLRRLPAGARDLDLELERRT